MVSLSGPPRLTPALTLAFAAPLPPAPLPAADGIIYHPLPAWTPGHPTPPTEWRHGIEVNGRLYTVSRPTWVASYISSLLPHRRGPDRVLARLSSGDVVDYDRGVWDEVRDAAARGYDALGDRRTYAAVMLFVAVLNFSSIVLVLLFFRGKEREPEVEEAVAVGEREGKIKLEE